MASSWVQQLNSSLELYAASCNQVVLESANEVTQFGRRRLEITSPKDTGRYSKNWRVKKRGSKFIVHNKDTYRLTHLLENGHVNRDGSRTAPRKHIRKVEQEMIRKFEQEVIGGIENL